MSISRLPRRFLFGAAVVVFGVLGCTQVPEKAPDTQRAQKWWIYDGKDTTVDIPANSFRALTYSDKTLSRTDSTAKAEFQYSCEGLERTLWIAFPKEFTISSHRMGFHIAGDSTFQFPEIWRAVSAGNFVMLEPGNNVDSLLSSWSGRTISFAYSPDGSRERVFSFDLTEADSIVDRAASTCGTLYAR